MWRKKLDWVKRVCVDNRYGLQNKYTRKQPITFEYCNHERMTQRLLFGSMLSQLFEVIVCLLTAGNITVTKNCWLNQKSIASVSNYLCKCSCVTSEKVKTVCPSGKVHSFKTKQTKNVKSAFNCFEEGKNDNCSNCISCAETPSRDERKDRLRKLKNKLPVATTALTPPPAPPNTTYPVISATPATFLATFHLSSTFFHT